MGAAHHCGCRACFHRGRAPRTAALVKRPSRARARRRIAGKGDHGMAKIWLPIASGGLFALLMGIALPMSETPPATGPHAGQKGEKGLGAVRARVVPETPILERDRLGQYLNWDFRIGND